MISHEILILLALALGVVCCDSVFCIHHGQADPTYSSVLPLSALL